MKNFLIRMILLVPVFTLFSCTEQTQLDPALFGIYEVILPEDITQQDLKYFENSGLIPDPAGALSPLLGTLDQNGSLKAPDGSSDEFWFATTAFPVGDSEGFIGVAALKPEPIVDRNDIRRIYADKDRVMLQMTKPGKSKWAKGTDQNIGRQVAFVISGKIYSMPLVRARISEGKAMITGLTSEEAVKLAETLNPTD